MAVNRFDELQRELEQTLVKLKAASELEQQRLYLREMSLAETHPTLQTPKKDTGRDGSFF